MNRAQRIRIALLASGLALVAWSCSSATSMKPPETKSDTGRAWQFPDLWRSLTTGKEYFVRMDKSHFYAQWVNLPKVSAQHGAYIHTACELKGSKWAGASDIFMPCVVGDGKSEKVANTCHLTLGIEINSITQERIAGRAQTLKKFDCGACKVIDAGWADFEWVPAK
ncbi:MAG: hypothetical protein EPN47_05645 [Acidobacteria bacterium]|nr:MAG: hypothetical protein EPN47_05645 [Acidobacteriota bacterium]